MALTVNNLTGFGANVRSQLPAFIPMDSFWRNMHSSGNNQTIYTFSATFGTANPSKMAIVAVCTRGEPPPNSVTVGGEGLDLMVSNVDGDASVSIWAGIITVGSTQDIVVTFAAGAFDCSVGAWTVIDQSPERMEFRATASEVVTDGSPGVQMPIETWAGGVLYCAVWQDGLQLMAWGGGPIEDDQAVVDEDRQGYASMEPSDGITDTTVTVGITYAGSANAIACAVSFR